jgi:hypothetical protein
LPTTVVKSYIAHNKNIPQCYTVGHILLAVLRISGAAVSAWWYGDKLIDRRNHRSYGHGSLGSYIALKAIKFDSIFLFAQPSSPLKDAKGENKRGTMQSVPLNVCPTRRIYNNSQRYKAVVRSDVTRVQGYY